MALVYIDRMVVMSAVATRGVRSEWFTRLDSGLQMCICLTDKGKRSGPWRYSLSSSATVEQTEKRKLRAASHVCVRSSDEVSSWR